ncbi:MAG TPA: glycosyltransferase family 2 protein [Saprospiraceae bacterium]|nr:glycosyltransferase family 2 protein [Lacibacter sp.]HMO89982.1 glycosyltransferase family 2 protein [Lacibacter sp.]HMQ08619.1 glycosyltransferase family 2 protein [Saprospiraceae bacterium]
MPFFSVVIAAYNKAQTIRTTLDSLHQQRFSDFEIIVVDDGSVDETATIVKGYTSSNLKYVYQENQGVTAARNKGVACSSGRYLSFLDADDWVAPDWLEQFHLLLGTGQYDIAFCDVEVRDQSKQTVKVTKARFPYRDTVEDRNGLFLTGAFCVERDFFVKLGMYDSNIRFGENAELSFRFFKNKVRRGFTDSTGMYYIISGFGGSKNLKNKVNDTLYILNKHRDLFKRYSELEVPYLQSIASSYFELGEYSNSFKYYFKSWLLRPFSLRKFLRIFRPFYLFIKRK